MKQRISPGKDRARREVFTVVVLAAIVAIGWANLLVLARRYTVDVLNRDMWVFYQPYFDERGLVQAFLRQHGPHRMGIGLIYEGIVMKGTGWNVRTLAQYVTVVLVLAAVLHLVAIHRYANGLIIADAVIPAWILSQRLGEHIVVWQSTSHSLFSLVFLGFAAISLTSNKEAIRWGGVCLIIPISIFTGFGFLIGPVLIWVLILEGIGSGWRPVHAITSLVIIISYGAFLWNYNWQFTQRLGGRRLTMIESWRESAAFASYMVASLLGRKNTGVLAAIAGTLGLMFLIGVVALLSMRTARRKSVHRAWSVSLSLCLYSLLYICSAAIGRQSWFQVDAAFQARYLAGLVPGVIGVWWLVRDGTQRWREWRKPAVGAISVVLLIPALRTPERSFFERSCTQKRAWVQEIMRTGSIERADENSGGGVLVGLPEQREMYQKIVEKRLGYLREHRLSLFRYRDAGDPVGEARC